jgi:hypothetical protein
VPPGIARDIPAAAATGAPAVAQKKKQKTSSEASSSSANTVTTMFSKKQQHEAAPITAKQNAVDGQKQVQRNFSMDHKLFKKFWQLVLCRKYQGKGYGEEIEAYMPPSQQEYNTWKELATSQGCTPTIVAQRAEYKKKLFEAFPAEFYWAKIDFSKMTKNMKRKACTVTSGMEPQCQTTTPCHSCTLFPLGHCMASLPEELVLH